MREFNCLIAGVGGQGTVLLSRLLAETAVRKGVFVRTSETIGMAQRGGGVVSHVRIATDALNPQIPLGGADLLIGFDPGEAVRNLGFLSENGAVLTSAEGVPAVTAALAGAADRSADALAYLRQNVKRAYLLPCKEEIARLNAPRSLNIYLLGAAVGLGLLPFSERETEKSLQNKFSEKSLAVNGAAFQAGIAAGRGVL